MRARKLEQVWNAPTSGQEIAQAYVPDGVRIEFARPGARLEGREAIAAHTQSYVTALPDCVLDIRGVHEANGITTLEWTFRGTHTGDVEGFPAQGEAIRFDGVSVLVMEEELVKEERVYWDAATLFGLMDAAADEE
jgi:steroid delta-isomerase-like uncharacterized protein